MSMKVYIIGAVTGHDREKVVTKFGKAAEALKSMGMIPINPVDIIPADTPWNEAMRRCINMLLTSDAVMLLSDWTTSKGATLEVTIAREMGMKELTQSLKYARL